MSAAGLAGVSQRKFVTTTVKGPRSSGAGRQAPDLVDRNFAAQRPNLLWVSGRHPLTLTAELLDSMGHQSSMAAGRCPIIWRQEWSDDPESRFIK